MKGETTMGSSLLVRHTPATGSRLGWDRFFNTDISCRNFTRLSASLDLAVGIQQYNTITQGCCLKFKSGNKQYETKQSLDSKLIPCVNDLPMKIAWTHKHSSAIGEQERIDITYKSAFSVLWTCWLAFWMHHSEGEVTCTFSPSTAELNDSSVLSENHLALRASFNTRRVERGLSKHPSSPSNFLKERRRRIWQWLCARAAADLVVFWQPPEPSCLPLAVAEPCRPHQSDLVHTHNMQVSKAQWASKVSKASGAKQFLAMLWIM